MWPTHRPSARPGGSGQDVLVQVRSRHFTSTTPTLTAVKRERTDPDHHHPQEVFRQERKTIKLEPSSLAQEKPQKAVVGAKPGAIMELPVFGVRNSGGNDCFICAIVSATMNVGIIRMLFTAVPCVKADVDNYLRTDGEYCRGTALVANHTVREAREIIRKLRPNARDVNPQQDAGDIITELLHAHALDRRSWYGSETITQCACEECGYKGKQNKTEDTITIVGVNEELVTRKTETERISDSKCEKCGHALIKYTRYKWSGKVFFMACIRRDRPMTLRREVELYISEKAECVGVLMSAICHLPSGAGGHYISVLRQTQTGPWYVINDSTVTEVHERDLGRWLPYATMLFYIRPEGPQVVEEAWAKERQRLENMKRAVQEEREDGEEALLVE